MNLKTRLDKLEEASWNGQWFGVYIYNGLTEEEAVLLRFGDEGPPKGARIDFVIGGMAAPHREVRDRNWATKRGTPEFEAMWAALKGKPTEIERDLAALEVRRLAVLGGG